MGTKFHSLFFRLPIKVSPNNGPALKERNFVSEAIFNLVRNKFLEVLNHPTVIVNHYQFLFSLQARRD